MAPVFGNSPSRCGYGLSSAWPAAVPSPPCARAIPAILAIRSTSCSARSSRARSRRGPICRAPTRCAPCCRSPGWLARTGLPLPPTGELRANLERATLIAPFRHLTRGFFAGREAELRQLAAYVDAPDPAGNAAPSPPILIHGPGGMGESALLAHFILEHSERNTTRPGSWRPFAYLDFDRPELDARDPGGVLLAIARQIAPQVPGLQAEVGALIEQWTARQRTGGLAPSGVAKARRNQLVARATAAADVDELAAGLAALLGKVHALMAMPLVLVLDTLEEVQYLARRDGAAGRADDQAARPGAIAAAGAGRPRRGRPRR